MSHSWTVPEDIWHVVMAELMENGQVELHKLPFAANDLSTVRKCLYRLEANRWLEQTASQEDVWYPGPNAREFIVLPDSQMANI